LGPDKDGRRPGSTNGPQERFRWDASSKHAAPDPAFGQTGGNSPQRQEMGFLIRASEQHEPSVLRLLQFTSTLGEDRMHGIAENVFDVDTPARGFPALTNSGKDRHQQVIPTPDDTSPLNGVSHDLLAGIPVEREGRTRESARSRRAAGKRNHLTTTAAQGGGIGDRLSGSVGGRRPHRQLAHRG
jgi:hypothetical protein